MSISETSQHGEPAVAAPADDGPGPIAAFFQILALWLFTLFYAVLTSVVMLVTLGRRATTLTPAMLNFWGRVMLRLERVELEVEGAEHLAGREMRIATFNHGSILDAFLVTAIMPRGSVAAIKREVLFYPLVGAAIWLMGFLIIDRGNSTRARRTMAKAGERMSREKLTVFIAPEGTRAKTADLLPFKRGAFHLALQSGAPIVPVVIADAFDVCPTGRLVSRPGKVRIRILPPRPTTHFTAENLHEEAEALRALYRTELARMHAERTPSP